MGVNHYIHEGMILTQPLMLFLHPLVRKTC